ncbi:MAG TPA: FecR family protein [Polyangia bacterium]|jgi:transmembrane sensor|nr:FecR family protein [Polyangia bacterium]
MSLLRFPLKTILRNPVDEAAIHRVQHRLEARLLTPLPRLPSRRLAVVMAVAVAAAAAIVTLARRSDPGPLRLADGTAVAAVEAKEAEARLSLSDGSEIRLEPGSRLEPLETSSSVFTAALTRGRAVFDVQPGGPRRWTIECGLAAVEVIGTRFSCAREPGRLRVNVERGSILVRGELVPERARRLAMGESIDVVAAGRATARPALSSPPSPPSPILSPPPVEASEPHPVRRAVATAHAPREHAGEADRGAAHPFATATPPVAVAVPPLPAAAELLAVADRERAAGRPEAAVAPLQRILTEMADDPQAPLAAFALGRLQLDSMNDARRAAWAFQRALALGLPSSLEEEARARLVEAYDRAGEPSAASAAARDLLRMFPHGRHAQAMRARLAEP